MGKSKQLFFWFSPLLSHFSAVFWKYRFAGFSWNFTISCTRFLAFQEGANSVRNSPTIDNQYTRRTRFLDQPFGLGDSWSTGKLMTFQALFSRLAEFGPYVKMTSLTITTLSSYCQTLLHVYSSTSSVVPHGRLAPMHAQLRQWEGQLFSCTESQAEWNFYFSRPDIARMP